MYFCYKPRSITNPDKVGSVTPNVASLSPFPLRRSMAAAARYLQVNRLVQQRPGPPQPLMQPQCCHFTRNKKMENILMQKVATCTWHLRQDSKKTLFYCMKLTMVNPAAASASVALIEVATVESKAPLSSSSSKPSVASTISATATSLATAASSAITVMYQRNCNVDHQLGI